MCLAEKNRKYNNSDIFSLGRVYLFLILSKENFMKFLFAPIKSSKDEINQNIENYRFLNFISKMTRVKNRMNLDNVESELLDIGQVSIIEEETTNKILELIDKTLKESSGIFKYLQNLYKYS